MQPTKQLFEYTRAVSFILRQELQFTRTIWQQVTEDIAQIMILAAREGNFGYISRKLLIYRWRKLSRKVTRMTKLHTNRVTLDERADHAEEMKLIEQMEVMVKQFAEKISMDSLSKQLQLLVASQRYACIASFLYGESVLIIESDEFSLAQQIPKSFHLFVAQPNANDDSQTNTSVPLHNNKVLIADQSIDTSIVWDALTSSTNPDTLLEEMLRITKHRLILICSDMEDKYTRSLNVISNWLLSTMTQVSRFQSLGTIHEVEAMLDIHDWDIIHQENLEFDPSLIPFRYYFMVIEPRN